MSNNGTEKRGAGHGAERSDGKGGVRRRRNKPLPLVVTVDSWGNHASHPWLRSQLKDAPIELAQYFVDPTETTELERWRIVADAAARVRARPHDSILVSLGPPAMLRCAALVRAMGVRAPHLCFSFHYPVVPSLRERLIVRSVMRWVDELVTYSEIETEVYPQMFGIPRWKMSHTLWTADETPGVDKEPPVVEGDYVAAIGASGRDYKTLFAAAAAVPHIRFVCVVRPNNVAGLVRPPNIEIHEQLPQAQTWNLLYNARLVVQPMDRIDSRCGHSVAVQAMTFGRPLVVSDTLGMRSYVDDGRAARLVPVGEPEPLASTMRELWSDEQALTMLGARGRAFAERWLQPEALARFFIERLIRYRLLDREDMLDLEQRRLDLVEIGSSWPHQPWALTS